MSISCNVKFTAHEESVTVQCKDVIVTRYYPYATLIHHWESSMTMPSSLSFVFTVRLPITAGVSLKRFWFFNQTCNLASISMSVAFENVGLAAAATHRLHYVTCHCCVSMDMTTFIDLTPLKQLPRWRQTIHKQGMRRCTLYRYRKLVRNWCGVRIFSNGIKGEGDEKHKCNNVTCKLL